MARLRRIAYTHRLALLKTATYYVMHITVAMAVAYAVTGSWVAALTLSLLEPSVQAVAYFCHERAWARWQQRSGPTAASSTSLAPAPTPV